MLELDHLAISAETLKDGREAIEAVLGVPLQTGGRHEHFGTHNLLLGLADELYLEVIAIDPHAPQPANPRWFDLDRFSGAPRLSNWICRTSDLSQAIDALPGAGREVALTRGDLSWRMAVPSDGRLPFDNCFPALIEWRCASHPSQMLAASGCRLRRLIVQHPDASDLQALLAPRLIDPRIAFKTGPAELKAEIETPSGVKVLA